MLTALRIAAGVLATLLIAALVIGAVRGLLARLFGLDGGADDYDSPLLQDPTARQDAHAVKPNTET